MLRLRAERARIFFGAEKVHSWNGARRLADPMYHTLGEITGAFNGACCRVARLCCKRNEQPGELPPKKTTTQSKLHKARGSSRRIWRLQSSAKRCWHLEEFQHLAHEGIRAFRPVAYRSIAKSHFFFHHILHYVCKDKCEEIVHELSTLSATKSLAEIPAAAAAAHAAGTTTAAWRGHSFPEMRVIGLARGVLQRV